MHPSRFFDAASTTPLDVQVQEAMTNAREYWGNENSKHCFGFYAQKAFRAHLETIADILKVSPDQLAVTYSGTDSNRRTLWALSKRIGWDHIFASQVEHSSILDEIPESRRFDPVASPAPKIGGGWGVVPPKVLCLTQSNSETGTIYAAENLRKNHPEALILRDYAQSYAKGIKPDLEIADFGSFSPQKFYGPKMIGLLYIKHPQNFQDLSKDTHTKSIPLLAGMAKAFELHHQESPAYLEKILEWDAEICQFIQTHLSDHKFHAAKEIRVPGLINVAFKGIRGGELMTMLSEKEGIAISTGSACTQDLMSPTHVIRFLEKDPIWQYPIRIGLHKYLTDEAVHEFCEILKHYVEEMRKSI